MNLTELRDWSHETARTKGWWKPVAREDMNGNVVYVHREFESLMALVHTEVSEAVEEIRNGHEVTEIYYGPDSKPEGAPIEMADAIIRVLDACGWYGIDIEAALIAKMRFNETRPYRHGGKTS